MNKDRVCGFDGCEKNFYCKGYCIAHYTQLLKGKKLVPLLDGRTKHPLYGLYRSMLTRCNNPNREPYRYYGGRGIIVCEEWKNDFWQFVKDMGMRPTPKHQIDREDNDGDYEPSNCRWATSKVNTRNSRTAILIVEEVVFIKKRLRDGLTQTKLAKMFGVDASTISRINTKQNWADVTI